MTPAGLVPLGALVPSVVPGEERGSAVAVRAFSAARPATLEVGADRDEHGLATGGGGSPSRTGGSAD